MRWELYLLIALASLGIGSLAGWQARDVVAESAMNKVTAANLAEAERQADIHSKSENFLRDQLDRANAANDGVHLGSVFCAVSMRDPSSVLQTEASSASGSNDPAADVDAARGARRDIGPDLERWARRLSDERERLRGLQYFSAEQAESVK